MLTKKADAKTKLKYIKSKKNTKTFNKKKNQIIKK